MPGIIFDNNDVLCEESGDRSMFPTLAETLMSSCLFFLPAVWTHTKICDANFTCFVNKHD